MSANFDPTMGNFKNMSPFKMWCQKVLPLTYDDSLSYYEVLCKLKNFLNEVIENMDVLHDDVDALHLAYQQLEGYVNSYFDNLNVQTEINNKLDAMALDGSLSDLIEPFVTDKLPTEVSEQIDSVVASQIGNTVAGQIGDVVGEQLPDEVSEQVPSMVTSWLNDHITQPVEVVIDDSLTIEGAAADAKATGDAVSELKSALSDIYKTPSENIFDGNFVVGEEVSTSTGAFLTNATYDRSGYIKVSAGVVNVGVKNTSASRVLTHYCLYDTAKQKLSSGQYNSLTPTTATDMKYVQIPVSADGYIAFDIRHTDAGKYYVSQVATPTKYVEYEAPKIKPSLIELDKTLEIADMPADAKSVGDAITSIEGSVSDINDEVDALYDENTTEETTELSPSWTSGYTAKNGAVVASDDYHYSEKISVAEGDLLYAGEGSGFRFLCAYDGDTPVSDKGSNDTITSYTVPSGIDGVVVSKLNASTVLYKTEYETEKVFRPDADIETIRGGKLTKVSDASMENGEGLYLVRNSLIRNKKIVFRASVTGDSWSVLVAHGVVDNSYDANTYSQGFIITPTTATPWTNGKDGVGGTSGTPWTHGLTITDRLEVIISVGNDQKYNLTLISESGMVSKDYAEVFQGRKGSIYAKALSGTFSNAILTFGCSDLERPIWLFGDSYVSIVENRYPYWMVESKVDNCLINSYPGEASANALLDCKELLKIATPRFIVWGIGMNDHDTVSAVNETWASAVNELSTICSDRHITLILCTIPNVTNTAYNNVKKNEWIEAHDYRYVDFNKAIGAADEVGATWPEGWLSSDNVHPTAMGARVLAMQIMADVPELIMP